MELLANRYIQIVIINLCASLLVAGVLRFIPELERKRVWGLYLIILAFGFGLFGWDISCELLGGVVLFGVGHLLFGFKKVIGEIAENSKIGS